MSPLELKRMQVELLTVSARKAELELRIHERMEEIERLQEHIAVQEAKEAELSAKLAEAQK
jgi:hypothetical protein